MPIPLNHLIQVRPLLEGLGKIQAAEQGPFVGRFNSLVRDQEKPKAFQLLQGTMDRVGLRMEGNVREALLELVACRPSHPIPDSTSFARLLSPHGSSHVGLLYYADDVPASHHLLCPFDDLPLGLNLSSTFFHHPPVLQIVGGGGLVYYALRDLLVYQSEKPFGKPLSPKAQQKGITASRMVDLWGRECFQVEDGQRLALAAAKLGLDYLLGTAPNEGEGGGSKQGPRTLWRSAREEESPLFAMGLLLFGPAILEVFREKRGGGLSSRFGYGGAAEDLLEDLYHHFSDYEVLLAFQRQFSHFKRPFDGDFERVQDEFAELARRWRVFEKIRHFLRVTLDGESGHSLVLDDWERMAIQERLFEPLSERLRTGAAILEGGGEIVTPVQMAQVVATLHGSPVGACFVIADRRLFVADPISVWPEDLVTKIKKGLPGGSSVTGSFRVVDGRITIEMDAPEGPVRSLADAIAMTEWAFQRLGAVTLKPFLLVEKLREDESFPLGEERISLKRGTLVKLYLHGTLREVVPEETLFIQGVECTKGRLVRFDPEGGLLSDRPSEDRGERL